MKFPLIILACILLLGTLQPEPHVEICGVWVDSSSLISRAAIDETLDRMDKGHFNLVNALIFEQGYCFWNSQLTEKSPDIEPGFDPLQYITEEAHKRGIQVHTWLIIGPVGLWSGEKGPILSKYPEWALQNPCGETYRNWLDLGSKEVRTFWCNIVTEIVQNYTIDGIHLDYIRYPGKGWGYNSTYITHFTDVDQDLLLKSTLPMYSFFSGNPLDEVTTAQVLAEFDTNVPAVVLNQYGRGTVILFNWYIERCEPKASHIMVERALSFLNKEKTYVYYAPETVDIYGWEPFSTIWQWAEQRGNPYWLEEEWFEPDPDGVIIFPYTYYLNEEAVYKLQDHVKAGGAAIFFDGPVFAMKYSVLRQIIGMDAVGDYFSGECSLLPVKEHEIIPVGTQYSLTQFKRIEREWDQFRKDQVTETVKQIQNCVKDKMLTAAVFDNKQNADSVLQDWYSWMDYLDYAMPMAYVSEIEELEEDLNEWERVLGTLDHIYPGLSVMTWWPTEQKKTHEEVVREIELCKDRGAKGVILFSLELMDDSLLDQLAAVCGPLNRFDYVPPTIEELTVKKGEPIVVSWKTDEPTRFLLHLKSECAEGFDVSTDMYEEYHEVTLIQVNPGTVYTVVIVAEDETGNQHTTETTFRTDPLPVKPIPDSSPSGLLYNITIVVLTILIAVIALFIYKRNT
jgi:uncharacterized lipoprotein YddW (UPF0748 family)